MSQATSRTNSDHARRPHKAGWYASTGDTAFMGPYASEKDGWRALRRRTGIAEPGDLVFYTDGDEPITAKS